MPVPVRGRQANFQGPIRDAVAFSPRHDSVEVLPHPALEPTGNCDSIARPAGLASAACRGMGPDFFFPADGVGLARARRVCARCPATERCLTTALDDPSLHGIWGGTSARERQYLRSEEGLGLG
jgi:WhiB family redox-sensing transcriptional regulator